LIPYKTLKNLSKILKNPSKKLAKNAEKISIGNFHTPKFPYLTFENKFFLRHESAISRTTDFSPNTPIRLLFSGFIHLTYKT
jgi:hypothetical protein